MAGRVLTVAESDTSGAAGIQADIKTILALGGYASTAVSCVTAQTTEGIQETHVMPPDFVATQMRAVLGDIGTRAIKIGYLTDEAMINAVGDVLDEYQDRGWPVVVDPSIVTRGGDVLVDDLAIAAWKRRLYLRTTVLTPNLKEAELLTGMKIRDVDDMRHAADMMCTLGVENVVLKAGQAVSDKVVYFVSSVEKGEMMFERPMLESKYTLGAGCTLASAIAVSLAQEMGIEQAIERALEFMHQAILNAQGFGKEVGPMNHAFDINENGAFSPSKDIKIHKAS